MQKSIFLDLKNKFDNYIKNISFNDRIYVISHRDLDGLASAILFEEILNKKGFRAIGFSFLDYKSDLFDEIIKTLEENKATKTIILDINIDNLNFEKFESLRKNFDTFIIDHHPINESVIDKSNIIKTDLVDCAALTIYRLNKEILNIHDWKWLLFPTMITEFSYLSKENEEFIHEFYPNFDLSKVNNSELREEAHKLGSVIIYYGSDYEKSFRILKNKDFNLIENANAAVEKEVRKLKESYQTHAEYIEKKQLYWYISSPKLDIANVVTTLVSMEEKDKTFVFVSNDDQDFVKISTRNQSGNIDLGKAINNSILGLEKSSGGGHKKAAGARILKKDLDIFKSRFISNI